MVHNDVYELIERVDSLRKRRGYSIMAMCERANVRPNTFYCWLEGIRSPNLGSLLHILDVLNVTIEIKEEDNGPAGKG